MESKSNLPREMVHKLTYPLSRFLQIEAVAGAALLFSAVIALVLTNSIWSESFLHIWELPIGLQIGSGSTSRLLHHVINDGLMTLFFFVVALELKRELVLGELRNFRMALLPLAGAVGGMLFPALLYLALMKNHPEVHGWGIVMATDTAFMIACLSILGSRIPSSLRLFLLSLAIFDDAGAILIVALGYGGKIQWPALGFGVVGFLIIALASRVGVRNIFIYSGLGFATWFCFEQSGIHPTFAGVVLGLMAPTAGWVNDARLRSILNKVLSYPKGEHWSGNTPDRRDLRRASAAARETLSPVERLILRLHPWVGFTVLPIFALANAGVTFSKDAFAQPAYLAIILGLSCGKPIGVFLMSWLAVRLGFATLLSSLNWSLIAAGSFLTGIGFTMSLFIANLALAPASLAAAKMGIMTASVLSATIGTLLLLWATARKGPHRATSLAPHLQ